MGQGRQHSNTSHVIVYLYKAKRKDNGEWDSNTSHVIVYPKGSLFSCARMTVFKYISCYCLSYRIAGICRKEKIQIHLMLLFIPNHSGTNLIARCNSNTSHVIVYLLEFWNGLLDLNIQIHLMLLFITDSLHLEGMEIPFKYISCYCLSFL